MKDPGKTPSSIVARYRRLKYGDEPCECGCGSRAEHRRSFLATTRVLAEDLQSTELPVLGGNLHLDPQARGQIRHIRKNRAMPHHSHIELPKPSSSFDIEDETYDLQEQNIHWLEAEALEIARQPQGIIYESSPDDEESESEDEVLEETPFTSPPQVRRDSVSSSASDRSGDDHLVELARNGDFAELWTAIKEARHKQVNESRPVSVYLQAVESFMSQWTAYTIKHSMMYRKDHSVLTANDLTSIGSSFKTCEPWYRDLDIDEWNAAQSDYPAKLEIQTTLRKLIIERAATVEAKRKYRKNVAIVTRIPKQTEEAPTTWLERMQQKAPIAALKKLRLFNT